MKLRPDKSLGCNYAPFIEERWKIGGDREVDQPPTTPSKPSLKRAMSLSTFHLMQTLKNSPAALRRRFRRDRTESLSHGDPLFKVHYLGTEKIFSLDREQALDAISHLLEGIANGKKKLSKDHALVVRPRYVEVKELSTGRQLTKTYLQDIAYCAADASRPNVFLYICKHHGQQLQCRVFWCSRAERGARHDGVSGAFLPAGAERLAAGRLGHADARRGEGETRGGVVQLCRCQELHAAGQSRKSSLEEERLGVPQGHHQTRICLRQLELNLPPPPPAALTPQTWDHINLMITSRVTTLKSRRRRAGRD
ncbi:uncharacterized protein [Embiotoca jacksoni]|uniref:uncharacterized protein n=1 Tax=Embiotoca jacksoni TaxID=100190 RepID=UPI003703D1AD